MLMFLQDFPHPHRNPPTAPPDVASFPPLAYCATRYPPPSLQPRIYYYYGIYAPLPLSIIFMFLLDDALANTYLLTYAKMQSRSPILKPQIDEL